MYYICYIWIESKKKMAWTIHDGINYLDVDFKTRKSAREYCKDNNMSFNK